MDIKKYVNGMKLASRITLELGSIALGAKVMHKFFPAKSFIGKVVNWAIVYLFYETACSKVIYSNEAINLRNITFDNAEDTLYKIEDVIEKVKES